VDNVLYFVDIDGKAVHSYDPSNGRHVKVDTPAKAAAVRATASTPSVSYRRLVGHGSRAARPIRLRHALQALDITRGAATGRTKAGLPKLLWRCIATGEEQALHARTAVIGVNSR